MFGRRERVSTAAPTNWSAALGGDFNGDGKVDGRDFLAWQRNPSVGNLGDWQANYGNASLAALGAVVPEPTTLLLLVGSLMLALRQLSQSSTN